MGPILSWEQLLKFHQQNLVSNSFKTKLAFIMSVFTPGQFAMLHFNHGAFTSKMLQFDVVRIMFEKEWSRCELFVVNDQ